MRIRYFPIRLLLVFSTFMLTVLLYIDRACISAAKEEISSDLTFDLTEFGWVMAMFTLGYAWFPVKERELSVSIWGKKMPAQFQEP